MNDDLMNDTPLLARSYDTDKFLKQLIPFTEILNKSYDTDSFFRSLIKNLTDKPLWVKQAIYIELRDNIQRMSDMELLNAIDKNDLLQLYVPRLSIVGVKIAKYVNNPQSVNLSDDILNFLKQIDGVRNVIDLCYINKCSLKFFAQLIISLEEEGYIEHFRSDQISNIFRYLADEMDIASLMLRIRKINTVQLAKIRDKHESMVILNGPNFKLEDTIVSMNIIDKEFLSNLLVLKEGSDVVFLPAEDSKGLKIEQLHEDFQLMSAENNDVKKRSRSIYFYFKRQRA